VDSGLKPLRFIRRFDRVEISPASLDRDWCWLSARYGFGSSSVSLAEILEAKREGRRFIGTERGWVDCDSPDLNTLDALLDRYKQDESPDDEDKVGLVRMDLFRLGAGHGGPVSVGGDGSEAEGFRRLLHVEPAAPDRSSGPTRRRGSSGSGFSLKTDSAGSCVTIWAWERPMR